MTRNFFVAIFFTLIGASYSVYSVSLVDDKDGKKIDLIGKVSLGVNLSKSDNKNIDCSFVRFGVKGEYPVDLNNKIKGYLEFNKKLNNDSLSVPKAFISVDCEKLGSLSYGRLAGVMNDITQYTAILPAFGGEALGVKSDMFGTATSTGIINYRSLRFNSFQLSGQYLVPSDKEDNKQSDKTADKILQAANSHGYGFSLVYGAEESTFRAGIAYNNATKSDKQKEHYINDKNAIMIAVGLMQKSDVHKIAATCAFTKNQYWFNTKNLPIKPKIPSDKTDAGIYAKKSLGFEIATQYKITPEVETTLAYLQNCIWIDEANKTQIKNVDYVAIGLSYKISKDINTYIGYKFNLLNENDAKILNNTADNACNIGFSYTI